MEIKRYEVQICDGCYELEGEMCDTPGCSLFLHTMDEVGDILNTLMVRPVVDGERLRLGQ